MSGCQPITSRKAQEAPHQIHFSVGIEASVALYFGPEKRATAKSGRSVCPSAAYRALHSGLANGEEEANTDGQRPTSDVDAPSLCCIIPRGGEIDDE